MKGLVYNGSEELSLTEVKDPAPGKGEVLINVKAAAICGSDVHGYLGTSGRRTPPMIMGHELSGEIAQLGEGATRFAVGDRVTVQPLIFCGQCDYCEQGLTNLCPTKRMYGVMDVDGAMAEQICVLEKLVYRLPESVTYPHGAMLEPLAVAYTAVTKAPSIEGRHVLVVGAGAIGLLVLQILKTLAPAKTFVSDVNEFRLDVAKRMGADVAINPANDDLKEVVAGETEGKGADIAFEVVGISATVQQAMSALRTGGTCVWVGNSEQMITLNMQEVVTRQLAISGTYAYTHEGFGEAIGLLAEQKPDLDPLISKVVPLDQGPEMFALLGQGARDLIKVILTN